MSLNYLTLKKKLLQYDVVTFDVFDTLITRSVLHPADVFTLVEIQGRHSGMDLQNYAEQRIKAECAAYKRFGENAGLRQIYQIMHEDFLYSEDQCKELENLEIATELRVTVPREPMPALLKELLNAGKHVVLCSDMYLNSGCIRQLLNQCGYPENLEIWVSCEHKGTKSSGKLWEEFFAELSPTLKFIHVGDNELGDYRALQKFRKDAVLLPNGWDIYVQSPLHDYLSGYEDHSAGSSLVLGYLINCACFNTPFSEVKTEDKISAVWGGAAFTCFMEYLVRHRDESELLFVTREGYVLQEMYRRYCRSAGVPEQANTLFYASRAAAVAATVISEKDVLESMSQPKFAGTLGEFTRNRMNFDLPLEYEQRSREIHLPEQKKEVFRLLNPFLPEIFANAEEQRKAYCVYVEVVRAASGPLTVVDVGYNGTIQFALSKILDEKVRGLYMFLNDGASPLEIGCPCSGMENPRAGSHPIYDNLLFLEAVMQVPYGQLQRMELQNGKAEPRFNSDANFSEYIPIAQKQFCEFIEWAGSWRKILGDGLKLDFDLAEAIWVSLLKFQLLPRKLLESFWLADDYCGTPLWKYDCDTQCWQGKNTEMPLNFQLVKVGDHLSMKQKIKQFIKQHIPYYAYDLASEIWIKYIK